ncbi:hypothetical protein ABEB36_010445 [Hypothenemus hampei]|uniref:CUE domain-containing protein n=1 Tax=Hypothenemus hampei TaxID=57062 RepID=A0ABD1EKA1_HYPHA
MVSCKACDLSQTNKNKCDGITFHVDLATAAELATRLHLIVPNLTLCLSIHIKEKNFCDFLIQINMNSIKHEVEEHQYYVHINSFKNLLKLPINEIYMEISWKECSKSVPKNFDSLGNLSSEELQQTYFESKSDVIPALDKRWLPKTAFGVFEPLSIIKNDQDDDDDDDDEDKNFLMKNSAFLEGLDHLLNYDFHQFWCTILFEPSATAALHSFLLNPILPFHIKWVKGECRTMSNAILSKFLLVYKRLLTFYKSEVEFMSKSFSLGKLKKLKLLNLPILITLASLYQDVSDLPFVNEAFDLYFSDTKEMDFLINELNTFIDQNLTSLDMIGNYVCGYDETTVVDDIPLSLGQRPNVVNLKWIYSLVDYLLSVLHTSNALFHLYNPSVEMAMNKKLVHRLPFIYANLYNELYELLECLTDKEKKTDLFSIIIEEINHSRSEFIELFHTFITGCVDNALQSIGNNVKQEQIAETYISLLTSALEEDYFICDYNAINSVSNQNDMFQSCCTSLDRTRTDFIDSCLNKLARNKKLQQLLHLKPEIIHKMAFGGDNEQYYLVDEDMACAQSGPSSSGATSSNLTTTRTNIHMDENETDKKIAEIIDMFPDLGDGFVLKCLQSYNYNSTEVINAMLESNLLPHLDEIPRDSIRIPPETDPTDESNKLIKMAFKGKKPDYDDALKLLNDKKDITDTKKLVLEGIQYNCEHLYDDEYDDRDNDDVSIPVSDSHNTEEFQVFNPNRQNRRPQDDDNEEEDEETNEEEETNDKNKRINFCEDPAVLRARREQARSLNRNPRVSSHMKGDVVGKAKGQGQDKATLVNRQKKNVNKSSRANHNRKGGAEWKRSKGMIPS